MANGMYPFHSLSPVVQFSEQLGNQNSASLKLKGHNMSQ